MMARQAHQWFNGTASQPQPARVHLSRLWFSHGPTYLSTKGSKSMHKAILMLSHDRSFQTIHIHTQHSEQRLIPRFGQTVKGTRSANWLFPSFLGCCIPGRLRGDRRFLPSESESARSTRAYRVYSHIVHIHTDIHFSSHKEPRKDYHFFFWLFCGSGHLLPTRLLSVIKFFLTLHCPFIDESYLSLPSSLTTSSTTIVPRGIWKPFQSSPVQSHQR